MVDLSQTIAPKSDQLNADDLIAEPRSIKIREVKSAVGGEQPIAIYFEGDGGKPFLPCKSMRRVLVALWGKDGSKYVGRSMRLYRDPAVTFGGLEVGGIRISHMSDITETTTVVLTANKKSRKPFTVKPMLANGEAPKTDPLIAGREAASRGLKALKAWWAMLSADLQKNLKPSLDEELKGTALAADMKDQMVTDEQANSIGLLLNSIKIDWNEFFDAFRVWDLAELKQSQLEAAKTWITAKK